MTPKRGDRVTVPPPVEEWDVRFGTGDAANGWEELCRLALANTRRCLARAARHSVAFLGEAGPGLGRPLVDTLNGSTINNLKELRPRSGRDVAIRLLFAFDPWSQAVLLVAGNKAGDWSGWYKTAIPVAESAYQEWLVYERKRREA